MKLQVVVLFLVGVFGAGTAELVDGQYYVLKNVADGTHMFVSTEALSCFEVADVGSTTALNTTDVRYKWKYHVNAQGFVNLLMDQERLETKYKFNIVSIHSGIWCSLDPRREFILHESPNATFAIQYKTSDNCINSRGDGESLDYAACALEEPNQYWEFIPV